MIKLRNGLAVGSGAPVRVNCNIGCNSEKEYATELKKIESIKAYGSIPDIMMDLSLIRMQKPLYLIAQEKLNVENLRAVMGERKIKKIAIINGSGQDYFQDALRLGADCIITGDTTYHFASDYKEIGLTIIDPGHFKTEWIVFLKVMKKVEEKFPEIEFIHSNECEDPYEFL